MVLVLLCLTSWQVEQPRDQAGEGEESSTGNHPPLSHSALREATGTILPVPQYIKGSRGNHPPPSLSALMEIAGTILPVPQCIKRSPSSL